jgi:UDP-N-acetylglucosamine--N-acetylmuramyl-(pentapeptide) pyrophosphoryl-undecaprenol N-acetylglucosamine transferase
MSIRTAKSVLKLGLGTAKAVSVLGEFRPDVVVGTGGYTSAGVLLAARLRGLPVVIHEQNSIPGRTNLMLAKIAKKVCVTFEESVKSFPSGKTVVTGLPVRPSIIRGLDRRESCASLGLAPDKFTVLVTGGSQGARKLNDAVLGAARQILDRGAQVLHLTGSKNFGDVTAEKPDSSSYVVAPYMDDMAVAYSAADLVVSRSGASTIAEITVRGLPAIFVPYPFAQADHQTKNAEAVANTGAAVIIVESALTIEGLAEAILSLIDNSARLAEMSAASKALGKPDAAKHIAQIVQEVAAVKLTANG